MEKELVMGVASFIAWLVKEIRVQMEGIRGHLLDFRRGEKEESSLHFGREVGDDPGWQRAHPLAKGGSGAHASAAERAGTHARLRPFLGRPKKAARGQRKGRARGWPVGPGRGKEQRLVGPAGREWGKPAGWASGR
jgi:hypothetical protein